MADFNLVMPKLGESVQEATIIKWLVKPGDTIQEDDSLLEIATDKVDSEIPSPVAGKVLKVLFPENALVPVGEVIAVINTDGTGTVEETPAASPIKEGSSESSVPHDVEKEAVEKVSGKPVESAPELSPDISGTSGRFYSPLVKSIALKENITQTELDSIPGKGTNGRVRKTDILQYLESRTKQPGSSGQEPVRKQDQVKVNVTIQPGDEIVEMDRMRKMIADHMVMSKHTSPHVTNFVEADVTNLVLWRERTKGRNFRKSENDQTDFHAGFC